MLLQTIVFDRHSKGWTKDCYYNIEYLRIQERYVNDMLMIKGHIFLKEIYDCLGVVWSSEYENKCVIYNGREIDRIAFEVFGLQSDGGIVINVLYSV